MSAAVESTRSGAVPVEGAAASMAEKRVERRILTELRQLVRLLHRVRLTAVTILTVLATWLLADRGAPLWALVATGCTGAGVFLLFWRQARAQEHHPLTPEALRWTFVGVILLQTCAIALTGGLRSPFLIAYVPSMTLAGVLSGQVRVVAVPFLMALSFVIGFLVLQMTGLAGVFPRAPEKVNDLLLAVLIPVATLVACVGGVALRRAFGRSVRAESQARARSVAAMQARNRELMALSSSLAHELKNPLAAIQGLTMNQARQADPGSREAERLQVVVSEVQRMGAILEEFLSFSRPMGEMQPESVKLSRLLDDLAALYQDHAAAMGVELVVIVEDEVTLTCDRHQLQHVLVNLVQNALDASPAGGRLELSGWRDQHHAVVEVTDHGEGLDMDVVDKIFEFGTTTRPQGSGIGLSISRTIVEAHGGKLTLENRSGPGCVATVRLPLEFVGGDDD